ncbi:MAG TPA: hypothetical protein VG123_15840, partial [Streptosporangiaceae bacterium]|nr:hypothetical protein [Streptosporangiaceae bacterium]
WPFIRRFTERVFAEDRMAVEAEQRAWDEQGRDRNHEVFPLILDVRHVLRSNGVPIRPDPPCAAPLRSGLRLPAHRGAGALAGDAYSVSVPAGRDRAGAWLRRRRSFSTQRC